ncbi:MAG: SMC-Scp complex subunit ScpB [Patescibacteria group bacterium]|nr:SMC-Scp complex subunit ScpB [Patescibacteria group bacterium]
MNELTQQLEALLFALGRPVSRTELQKLLDVSPEELGGAIEYLTSGGRGVVLVDDGKMLELRTAPAAAALIERICKEEYARDIGRAGLEALAAVLYRGPLTRAEIDFIRGVNSSQTLRTLAMRGLVRKVPNPKDERSFLYEPTTELLAQLGVSHRSLLPEFNEVRDKLSKLEEAYRMTAQADAKESELTQE